MDWLLSKIKNSETEDFGFVAMTTNTNTNADTNPNPNANAASINSEPLMDCRTCQVHPPLVRTQIVSLESKCCDFNPFVSGFAVGAWLQEGGSREQLLTWVKEKGVLTRLGVAQPALRSSQQRPRCQFYSREKEGECAIWSHRPSICRSYFCAHSSDELKKMREEQENILSDREAQLLSQWFVAHGGKPGDWQMWVEYMETPYGGDLPESLLFSSQEDAMAHYQKMWQWLQKQG